MTATATPRVARCVLPMWCPVQVLLFVDMLSVALVVPLLSSYFRDLDIRWVGVRRSVVLCILFSFFCQDFVLRSESGLLPVLNVATCRLGSRTCIHSRSTAVSAPTHERVVTAAVGVLLPVLAYGNGGAVGSPLVSPPEATRVGI